MGTTSVPPIVFTPAGIVVPPEASLLEGVLADFNAAMGGNINPSLSTPQGQLATSTAAAIAAGNSVFAQFVNNVDPATSSGIMQDAIGGIISGFQRLPGIATTVNCLCTGSFGTAIPLGALVKDSGGNTYYCNQSGTIPLGGSVTLSFTNVVTGALPCASNSVTVIYRAVPGWDTVNNPTAGVTGSDGESRAQFEARRGLSVAKNASGFTQAILANVLNVPGVTDAYVYNNNTSGVVNVGTTPTAVAARSIYVAAVGGDQNAVALAIWQRMPPGCDYTGSTTVTVNDTNGYSVPYPSYSVKFTVPASQAIKFSVNITNTIQLPANIVTLVQTAILNAFAGLDGGARAKIGSTILASRYYGPISLAAPTAQLISVLLGPSTPTLTSYIVGIDKSPTLSIADIAVNLV
jgi:hypothetical protein